MYLEKNNVLMFHSNSRKNWLSKILITLLTVILFHMGFNICNEESVFTISFEWLC